MSLGRAKDEVLLPRGNHPGQTSDSPSRPSPSPPPPLAPRQLHERDAAIVLQHAAGQRHSPQTQRAGRGRRLRADDADATLEGSPRRRRRRRRSRHEGGLGGHGAEHATALFSLLRCTVHSRCSEAQSIGMRGSSPAHLSVDRLQRLRVSGAGKRSQMTSWLGGGRIPSSSTTVGRRGMPTSSLDASCHLYRLNMYMFGRLCAPHDLVVRYLDIQLTRPLPLPLKAHTVYCTNPTPGAVLFPVLVTFRRGRSHPQPTSPSQHITAGIRCSTAYPRGSTGNIVR